MDENLIPSLENFLTNQVSEIAKTAPTSMIYSVGGTRRRAALANIPRESYADFTREQMVRTAHLIFQHGVQHLFMPVAMPEQFSEVTPNYREYLWHWTDQGTAGPEALADYERYKWRVRIVFNKYLPRLTSAETRLEATLDYDTPHNLWFLVIPDYDLPWQVMVDIIHQAKTKTHAEAVRLLYGEDVPPVTLYLGTGKTVTSLAWLPPFLLDKQKVQFYWSQRPGYSLDQEQLRTILHDYYYLRRTWLKDKSKRPEQALAYRQVWDQGPTIGVGTRLGPYWYPAPFTLPNVEDE